jgi:hypothetical protein
LKSVARAQPERSACGAEPHALRLTKRKLKKKKSQPFGRDRDSVL